MKTNFLLLILVGFGFITSCTQDGCTDKSALNYQVTATNDDGSCIFCQEKEEDKGTLVFSLTDARSWSSHYNDQVVSIEANQANQKFNDGSCGQNGCYTSLKIKNLVAEEILGLNFLVSITSPLTGSTMTHYIFQGLNIKPGQTVILPKAYIVSQNSCVNISTGTAGGELIDATYF